MVIPMDPNASSAAPSENRVVRRAYTVKDAVTAYGVSRSRIYVLLKAGKLRDRKVGCRRVILAADLDALLGVEG